MCALLYKQLVRRPLCSSNDLFLRYRRSCRSVSVQHSTAAHMEKSVIEETKDEFDDYFYKIPDDITQMMSEKLNTMNDIIKEMDVRRFKCQQMPKNVSSCQWLDILKAETFDDRTKLCKYYYHEEKVQLLKKIAKMNYCQPYVSPKEIVKKLFHSRVLTSSMNKTLLLKVMKVHLQRPHIIVDCSYDNYMTDQEIHLCAHQLIRLHNKNANNIQPFNIIHCNVQTNGPLMQAALKANPSLLSPNGIFNYSEKSFIDLFPQDQLVYLSPHADDEIENYDPSKIYILGAFVDLTPKDGISVSKAEVNGLQTMKLPLDKYLNWCTGTKSLCFDEVVQLMNDRMSGITWEQSLNRLKPTKKTYSIMNSYRSVENREATTKDILRTSTFFTPFYKAAKYSSTYQLESWTKKNGFLYDDQL